MRLLFLLPFVPDPQAPHGGGAYLGHLLRAIARQAEVGVIAMVPEEEMVRWQATESAWRWRAAVPLRSKPHGLARLPHTLRMLWRWRRTPLVAAKYRHPSMAGVVRRALAEFRPDAAMVELAQMAQYLPCLQSLPTVFTDHESGCPANTTTGLGRAADRRDGRLWQSYVHRYYPMADLVQTVTTEDAAALGAQIGRTVVVRPPVVEQPAEPIQPAKAGTRALFLGDYRHEPNVEAARTLVHDVLPHLRSTVPAAELWLAGAGGERLAGLGSAPGVRILGFVPDLFALFAQVRLVLAPVWSGGGFRMKSLTALAHGLPVVTNTLGARGIAAPAEARVVTDDHRALAAAAAHWMSDAGAAAAAGRAAYTWVRDHLSTSVVAADQLQRLRALRHRPRA